MLTRASNLRKANATNDNVEFFEISSRGDMEPQHELESASSSDGQADLSKCYIHVEDYFGAIRDLENGYRLRELETERRMQEISGNNKMMFQAELHKVAGGNEIHSMQQQNVIDDLVTQVQVQRP